MESALLSIGAAFGDRVIGFIVFAIVVRFVDPRDVGLVALSAQFVDLANAVSTSGLGERVMQRRAIDARITATLFWTHALISVPVVIILAGIGPLLAWSLDEPILQPLMLLLSASLVLNVFVTIPAGLLARELRYRPITLLSVLSTLFGGAVAIVLAVSGLGLWALAAQRVAGVAFYAAGVTVVTRYRPLFAFDRQEFMGAVRFALPLMGSQAVIALPGVVTSTAIGRNLGVEVVGQLRIAQRLLELLSQLVISPVMRVFIPVFSGTAQNRERFGAITRRVIDALALPVLPMYAIAAVVAEPLTRIAFGPGWEVSAALFRVLALHAPLIVLSTVTWPALVGIGRTAWVFRLKVIEVTLSIAVALVFSPFGVFVYVWATVARAVPQLLANAWLLGRAGEESMWRPIGQLVVPGLAALACFAVGHLLVEPFLPPMHPVLTLGLLGGAAGLVALAVLAALAWHRMKDLVLFVWKNVSPAGKAPE